MTVSSQIRQATSLCNGATRSFPVPFPVVDDGDLQVVLISPIGTEAVLAEGVDYTLSGDLNAGVGSVVTTTAYPTGTRLRRRRVTQRTQATTYSPNDGFPAAAHERGLDKLTMIAIEVDEDRRSLATRSILVPDGETGGTLPPLIDRAGLLAVFAADGGMTGVQSFGRTGGEIQDDGVWSLAGDPIDDGVWG